MKNDSAARSLILMWEGSNGITPRSMNCGVASLVSPHDLTGALSMKALITTSFRAAKNKGYKHILFS
jgi:hypothetical protein